MAAPLSREKLISFGRCCGNICVNCPYEPKHVGGTTELAPAACVCYVCAGKLVEIRGKQICSQCRTINETCCDGGQCH